MKLNLKPIKGYENKYAASIEGDIYNISYIKPRKLKPSYNQKGYKVILFYIKRDTNVYEKSIKTVHRVVWEAFNGAIEEGSFINFKDGNKNNTSLTNLYITKSKLVGTNGPKSVSITRVLPDKKNRPFKKFFSSTSEAARYLHLTNADVAKYAKEELILGWKIEYLNK